MPKTNRTTPKGRGGVTLGPVGGAVTPAGPFRPRVRLDPSKVRDLRGGGRSLPEEIVTRVVGGAKTSWQNMSQMHAGRNMGRSLRREVQWASPDSIRARLRATRKEPRRIIKVDTPSVKAPGRTTGRRVDPRIKMAGIPRITDIARADPNLLRQATGFAVDTFRHGVNWMNNERARKGQRRIDMPGVIHRSRYARGGPSK